MKKNKILFGTMLALLLVGSVSFADDDADKKRLLEEYDKMQAEKAKEAERLAKKSITRSSTSRSNRSCWRKWRSSCNRRRRSCTAPKKAEKDMTESERMDVSSKESKKEC